MPRQSLKNLATPFCDDERMFTATAIGFVILVWRFLAFVDDYIADIPLGRKLGSIAAGVLGALSIVSPPAFAAGTNRYITEASKPIVEWITNSIQDVLDGPVSPTPTTQPTSMP